MATTPKFSWPVPVAANAPNVPFDMNALAVAIEGTVGNPAPYALSSWVSLVVPGTIAPVSKAPQSTADVRGGMTISGVTGHVTVPRTGLYALAFGLSCDVVGTALGIGVGTPSTRTDAGYSQVAAPNSKLQLYGGMTRVFNAGDVVCPWAFAVGGATGANAAYFVVTFAGW